MDFVRVRPASHERVRAPADFAITPDLANPAYQAYLLLRNVFTVTFVLCGADKFLNALVDWVQYVAPAIPRSVGVPAEIFVRGVGVVEIALGVLLAFYPRQAAYAIAVWLWLIVVDLAMVGTRADVALRDLGLSLAALALARLAAGVHAGHAREAKLL